MNTGKLFPDKAELDLKGFSAEQRKVLYYNILFPGMGFVYAGDVFRSLVFGGGSVLFLFLGFFSLWGSAVSGEIRLGSLMAVMVIPGVCFAIMLTFHLLSILKSASAKISRCSIFRAVLYTAVCSILAVCGVVKILATVWFAVPWQ